MKMTGKYGQNSFSTADHSIFGQSLGKHNWHRKQDTWQSRPEARCIKLADGYNEIFKQTGV